MTFISGSSSSLYPKGSKSEVNGTALNPPTTKKIYIHRSNNVLC